MGLRHNWYQNDEHVVLTLFVKGLRRDELEISYTSRTMTIRVSQPDQPLVTETFELYAEIEPSSCEFELSSMKVEVQMKKAVRGLAWKSLTKMETPDVPSTLAAASATSAPSYPSSARRPKDWNAIESDIKQEEKKTPTADGGDPANALFQQIYAGATEEQRRAMNKSFMESGGTCLSTNWDEVGKERVPVRPPEGMEPKRFEF